MPSPPCLCSARFLVLAVSKSNDPGKSQLLFWVLHFHVLDPKHSSYWCPRPDFHPTGAPQGKRDERTPSPTWLPPKQRASTLPAATSFPSHTPLLLSFSCLHFSHPSPSPRRSHILPKSKGMGPGRGGGHSKWQLKELVRLCPCDFGGWR